MNPGEEGRVPRPRKIVRKDFDDMGGILTNEPGKPVYTTGDSSIPEPEIENTTTPDENTQDEYSLAKEREDLEAELAHAQLELGDPTIDPATIPVIEERISQIMKKLGDLELLEKKAADLLDAAVAPLRDAYYEKNRDLIIDSYLYDKGVPLVIIHGADTSSVDTETGETENGLKQKIDLDVYSSLKLMQYGGVKFTEGAQTAWINPKEKIKYDEERKPYYDSAELVIVLDAEGNLERDTEGNQKLEIKPKRLYLPPGTILLDVGGTYGATVVEGDIIQIDHHGEKNKYITSATRELFNVLEKNPRFEPEFLSRTKTENVEWFKKYIDFVTSIDNLSYDTSPRAWEKHHNTLYAVQRYFNSFNPGVMLDLFRNYPTIHPNALTREDRECTIAIGDRYYDPRNKRQQVKNLRPLTQDGESKTPDFFKQNRFGLYDNKLISVGDIVDIQKRSVDFSNKAIKEKRLRMYMNNLSTDSSVLGKVLFNEMNKTNDKFKNHFSAVAAYGNGYDTYVIFNTEGHQKNEIFVSSKENTRLFSVGLKNMLKDELGDAYTEELVTVVRDAMVLVRDPLLKSLDTSRIRDIIVKALQIGGYTEKASQEHIAWKIDRSHERTQELRARLNL